MCPAVPTIIRELPRSQAQRRELRGEFRLIGRLQAANIEPQRAVGDATDDRPWQLAQRLLETGETGALPFDGPHREAVARQLLEWLCTAADLTQERRPGDLVALTERLLESCVQPRRLRLEVRQRPCQQPQGRQAL